MMKMTKSGRRHCRNSVQWFSSSSKPYPTPWWAPRATLTKWACSTPSWSSCS